jgi:hypothetical protein
MRYLIELHRKKYGIQDMSIPNKIIRFASN